LGHLAGQIREGHASELTLLGGLAGFGVGILLLVLADLGTRLVRIEMELGTLPEDLFGTERTRTGDGDHAAVRASGEPGATHGQRDN
jgi:hypothetical protein